MTTLAAYLDRTAVDLTVGIGSTPMPGIQTYLGATDAEKPLLRAWYAAAIDWCHKKLSERDFVDGTGASVNPPDSCVLGVYVFAEILREYHLRANKLARKIKTGAREEEYDIPGMAGRISAASIAAWPYIEQYCEDVLLLSSGGR